MLRVTREFELDPNQPIIGRLDDVARSLKIDKTRYSFLLPLPLVTSYANSVVFLISVRTEYSQREVQDAPVSGIILRPYSRSRWDDKALPCHDILTREIRKVFQVDLEGDQTFSPN